jgi:hypothetical protein
MHPQGLFVIVAMEAGNFFGYVTNMCSVTPPAAFQIRTLCHLSSCCERSNYHLITETYVVSQM